MLTSANPTLLQRAASALPFYYWRANAGKNPDHRPVAVIDLGAPANSVWTSVAGSITQVAALDPEGAVVRASTRTGPERREMFRRAATDAVSGVLGVSMWGTGLC